MVVVNPMANAAVPTARYVRVPVRGHGVVGAVWYREAGRLEGSPMRVAARTHASVVAHLDEAHVETRRAGARSATVLTSRAVGFDVHPWVSREQLAAVARAAARTLYRGARRAYVNEVLGRCDTTRRDDEVSALAMALDARPDRTTIQSIGERAAVSPRTLRRQFAAAVGMSADRYRVIARATRAREILMSSATPLATLAYHLGYADQSHLHRDMLELTGATPTTWREHGSAWNAPT